MPPPPSSRSGKKAGGKPIKSVPGKKKQPSKNNPSSSSTKQPPPDAGKGNAESAASTSIAPRNPNHVPAPAAVLLHALGLPLLPPPSGAGDTSPATSGPSPSLTAMEVEVETKQGYTYTGKLSLLDADYNVVLHESLVRRARDFDVERALRIAQQQREARLLANSLQGTSLYDAHEVTGGASSATQLADQLPRPRYIGTVALRSNNVVLLRFVEPTPAAAVSAEDSAWGRLRKAFSDMSAAIKAHLLREKMRRRAARRQRLEAKKASP